MLQSEVLGFQCCLSKSSGCLRSEKTNKLSIKGGKRSCTVCAISLCYLKSNNTLYKQGKVSERSRRAHILKAEIVNLQSSKRRSDNYSLCSLVARRKKLQAKITGCILNETWCSTNTVGELENTGGPTCHVSVILFMNFSSQRCDLPLTLNSSFKSSVGVRVILGKYEKCGKTLGCATPAVIFTHFVFCNKTSCRAF